MTVITETIARAIDQCLFEAHKGLVDYCLFSGDDQETAERYAHATYGASIDAAMSNAEAAIAALKAAGYSVVREDDSAALVDMLHWARAALADGYRTTRGKEEIVKIDAFLAARSNRIRATQGIEARSGETGTGTNLLNYAQTNKMTDTTQDDRDAAQAYLDDPRHRDAPNVQPRTIMNEHFARHRAQAERDSSDAMRDALAGLLAACEQRANDEGGDFGPIIGPAALAAEKALGGQP